MSQNQDIEEDYKASDACIEQMAQEELTKIRKKAEQIKKQAERIGERVEAALGEPESKDNGKKD